MQWQLSLLKTVSARMSLRRTQVEKHLTFPTWLLSVHWSSKTTPWNGSMTKAYYASREKDPNTNKKVGNCHQNGVQIYQSYYYKFRLEQLIFRGIFVDNKQTYNADGQTDDGVNASIVLSCIAEHARLNCSAEIE